MQTLNSDNECLTEMMCLKYDLPQMSHSTFISIGVRVKRIYKLDNVCEDSDEFFRCFDKFLKTKFGKNIFKKLEHIA